ncbi:MAG: FliM/FliN family flagellar motor switch protein [Deltaproteobacteria bacterium]|nr:FliM/FliN family flagellar motor switch protein [Deltaproteobacteria bacterium]
MSGERRAVRWPSTGRAFVAARDTVLGALRETPDRPGALAAIGRPLGLPIRLLGLEPAPAPRPKDVESGWCVHLRDADGAALVLRVEGRVAAAVAAAGLGIDAWALPEEDGAEAVAGVLTLQALRCLAALAATGRPVELVDLHRASAGPPESGGAVGLSLRLLVGDTVGRATVHVVPGGTRPRSGGLPGWLAGVPLEAAVVVARGRVARRELRALAPGDAVVLDEAREGAGALLAQRRRGAEGEGQEGQGGPAGDGTGTGWLAVGGLRWPCRANAAETWTIEGPPARAGQGRDAMSTQGSDRTEVISAAGAGAAIDDVPIEVAAVAGRLTMTVGELAALEVGTVVGLRRSPAGAVELLANGVPVARGRLIDLEGELAVEVTELRAPQGPG